MFANDHMKIEYNAAAATYEADRAQLLAERAARAGQVNGVDRRRSERRQQERRAS